MTQFTQQMRRAYALFYGQCFCPGRPVVHQPENKGVSKQNGLNFPGQMQRKTSPFRVGPLSPAVRQVILALGLMGGLSAAHAALSPVADTIPSALAPVGGNMSQLAQLAGNDIVIYGHAIQPAELPTAQGQLRYNAVRFNTGAVVLAAKPEQVKQLLSRYTGYHSLFPTLTKASVVEQSGNVTRMKYHVHVPVPIPILNYNEDVVMQHQLNANSILTFIVDSPIQYGMGKFEWFAIDANHTLVTLTQWGDLDKPKGFLVSTILKAIPEVKQGIPQSVNTFVLETLKRKFADGSKPVTLQPRQLPGKELSAGQQQLIETLITRSGSPVMFIHRPSNVPYSSGPESMQFVTSFSQLKAPLARSYQVLSSPANFKAIFSQVSRVETKPLANQQGTDAAITVKVGLGVIAIPFRLNLRYFKPASQQIYYQANGGDIEFMQGQMQLSGLNNQHTLVQLTQASKIGPRAPFLLRLGKSMPYADLLPSVGGNVIFMYKVNDYLSKTAS